MFIRDDIVYIGVNDHDLDLFEGQYPIPNGMAYNSYLIKDEKTLVMDSVEERFSSEWLESIAKNLDGKDPDYLMVQHMEPDHSSSITKFMEKFPNATIVSSDKSFGMMKNFYGSAYEDRRLVVKEGDSLELGKHVLKFFAAPMVHWPEVLITYDETEKVLFTADAFGTFGANDVENPKAWPDEARRYYIGIVGKYGGPVQTVFKKLEGVEIKTICSLHGPVLSENPEYYLGLYKTWSSYDSETKGVFIAYTSIYGNTKKAAEKLFEELKKQGTAVEMADLARCDMFEAVAKAFQYDKVVFATTTYNGSLFPFMHTYINALVERSFQKKKIGLIENGSWTAVAAKKIINMLEPCKDLEFCNNLVSLKSGLSKDNEIQIQALAEELK